LKFFRHDPEGTVRGNEIDVLDSRVPVQSMQKALAED
jgi:hypothetical protein